LYVKVLKLCQSLAYFMIYICYIYYSDDVLEVILKLRTAGIQGKTFGVKSPFELG